jgi:hypothetical protein
MPGGRLGVVHVEVKDEPARLDSFGHHVVTTVHQQADLTEGQEPVGVSGHAERALVPAAQTARVGAGQQKAADGGQWCRELSHGSS